MARGVDFPRGHRGMVDGGGAGGGSGITFGSQVPGPSALGAPGVAVTARRSDQGAPAYRSDLPLSPAWFVDPLAGSDAATNPGNTAATALRSLAELKRRWWGAEITVNTAVTLLGNIDPSDMNAWHVKIAPGVTVTLVGSLGVAAGFGGRVVDNTLYTGSVTGFVAASQAPGATDTELSDAGVPVSYTAAGLMAAGILFQRTNATPLEWFAWKDLFGETPDIRMTQPMHNLGVRLDAALTVGDAYKAFRLWQIPSQFWGPSAAQVVYDSLQDIGGVAENILGYGCSRKRCWITRPQAGAVNFEAVGAITNCMFGDNVDVNISAYNSTFCIAQGLWCRGTNNRAIMQGRWVFSGAWGGQSQGFEAGPQADLQLEQAGACFDLTTRTALTARDHGLISMTGFGTAAGGGLSGIGNTGGLLEVDDTSVFAYSDGTALPPFSAATTTSATPIKIAQAGVDQVFPVAALPALAPTELRCALRADLGLQSTYQAPATPQVYATPELDFTAAAGTQVVFNMPTLAPGMAWMLLQNRVHNTAHDGTVTSGPVVKIGNNATHDNFFAPGAAIANTGAVKNSWVLYVGTPPLAMPDGSLGPLVVEMVTPAVLGTATKFKGKFVFLMVPVDLAA